MKKAVKIEDGWRVCFLADGTSLRSLFQPLDEGAVNYIPGKRTLPLPGCGPLTVLKSFEAGRFLLKNQVWKSAVLVKCRYKPSTRKTVWCQSTIKKIPVRFLEETNLRLLLPGSTVLAEWIEITQIVARKMALIDTE